MAGFGFGQQGEVIGAFAQHLESRINLVQAEMSGASARHLERMPPPAYMAIAETDENLLPEIAAGFSPLYLTYLEWHPNRLRWARCFPI
jgi:hypothetical protein